MVFKMRTRKKQIVKKLVILCILTAITFSFFTIPLIALLLGEPLAPLGDILFPGTGIWRTPGEIAESEVIYVEGLDDEVMVYRDEWGVPHVYAESEEDLMFALGFVHAQDRLFQMDMARRQVRGMLSEVVGEFALESDKYNLAMGMEYWAKETLKELKEMDKDGEIEFFDAFERYAEGVNHYIETHRHEWPVEYSILGFQPTEWTLLDSLCFSKYMSKMLTWQYDDLYRLINHEALTSTQYNELFNVYSPYQVPICPNYGSFDGTEAIQSDPLGNLPISPQPSEAVINSISEFLTNVEQIESEKRLMELSEDFGIGSNNWVVDGIKSSTGKPILCNDMHLAWNVPGIWYQAHLVAEDTDLNTYGFTLAGVPIPIVAHNEHVAWGLTNTGYDVMDWYYFEEVDDDHYTFKGDKKEYDTRTYTINVKYGAPVEFEVKETVWGPVLNKFLEDDEVPDSMDDNDIVICPRWTANDITYEFNAIYGFNHASNRQEFNESSTFFQNPAQNIVYADVDGTIAIRPTGLVPIRQGNGTFPYDGSAGEGEWTGYLDILEDLPHSENPSQHYLASANQIAVGPDYTNDTGYILQNSYAAGYRARRINELLNNSADGTVGVEKMKEIQLDVKSTPAKEFTAYLIEAIENMPESDKSTIIKNTLNKLKNWDFDMDRNLAAPTIYRKWRDLFMKYTFKDEWKDIGARNYPQLNVLEKLMKEDPNSLWFDDIETKSKTEDRDDIILEALEDTLDFLKDIYGTDDVNEWRWGYMHQLEFPHILGLESFGKGPYEGDGEGYTVNPSRVNIEEGPDTATGGASERMIIDFSNMKNSISCIPSGQTGISNSEHYADQLEELFLEGKYHRHYFYDKAEDFPKEHVESYISFVPAEEFPIIVPIVALILIPAFSVGIIFIIVKGRQKILAKREDQEIEKEIKKKEGS